MLFPIVLKMQDPNSFKKIILEERERKKKKELLNYLLQYFFLAGNVIESQAIAAMIYEQLLEDDKPTM
jgi:cell division protein FtsI/penicillin-binding protein 2